MKIIGWWNRRRLAAPLAGGVVRPARTSDIWSDGGGRRFQDPRLALRDRNPDAVLLESAEDGPVDGASQFAQTVLRVSHPEPELEVDAVFREAHDNCARGARRLQHAFVCIRGIGHDLQREL